MTVTLAPIWIALAAALAARDGCGSDAQTSGSGSGSAIAAPTLVPSAATGSGSAAPTTTTMSRDAQAKLDKLVGAKPGTHKPIKPTPEPPVANGSGSASPKPAKPRNPYPSWGRHMTEREMFDIPDMDRDKETYDYGATVRQGQTPAPRYVAYRCVTKPTCNGWARMGSDWKIVGWWGTETGD